MANDRKLTAFFFQHARKSGRRYLLAIGLIPICSLLAVALPKIFQVAVDDGIGPGDHHVLTTAALIFLGLGIMHVVSSLVQMIVIQTAGMRTLRDIRADIVRHVVHIGKRHFEKQPLGVFISRSTGDVEAISESLSIGLVGIITDLFTIVATFTFLIFFQESQDRAFGLSLLILVPVLTFIIEFIRRRLRGLHEHARGLNGRMAGQFNEALSMCREVTTFHLAPQLQADFAVLNTDYRDTNIKAISYDAATFSIIEGMKTMTIGLLVLLSVMMMHRGMMTPGELAMYVMYINLLFAPFTQLGQRLNVLQASYAALNKIDQIVSLPLPEDHGTLKVVNHDISLHNVSFAYTEDGPQVLNDLSLHIDKGKSLAIVGPTGSGKSTIVRLMTRLYDVDHGYVCIGGEDIKAISRQSLKESVVFVPQDPAIFYGSIVDNISLFRPNTSIEQIRQVCHDITAAAFIERLPEQYDTVLKTDGSNISMGQRQLIALARALVSGAEILIFDESTANIDTETERSIQKAQEYIIKHKTTILIAHRLSTIRHVDQIIVLQNGSLVQKGNHDTLLNQDGLYRMMYELEQT